MGKYELGKKFPVELLCLSLLDERDMYGYEMLQEFKKRSHGRISVNITTLYMALKRLEDRKYVSVHYSDINVRGKRTRLYYRLEPSSYAYKEQLLSEFQDMVLGVQDFLNYSQGGIENGE